MKLARILTILMMLCPLGVHAQRTDIIVTRDGNTYEGYLAKQIPNKSITIVSSKTTIKAATKDTEAIKPIHKMLGDLSEDVIAMFPLLQDDDMVEIADITVEGLDGRKTTYRKSVILEKGESLKFVSFASQSFDLDWSQVKVSSKVPYDFTSNTGLRDYLTLPNGKILEGQMMEQDLRSGIIKFRETNGKVTGFHKKKILSIRYEPVDADADIWEQIPYCDRLNLKDGSSVDGFIVSKLFGEDVEFRHFNSIEMDTYDIGNIVSYEKYKNPFYTQTGEIPATVERYANLYVNGEARHISTLRREKNRFSVTNDIDSLKIRVHAGERVVIKYYAEARTSQFVFAKAKLTKEKVYGLSGLTVKDKGEVLHPVFSKSDIVTDYDINFQANEGGYIVADFVLKPAGVYVFFVNGDDRCFVIYAQ